jgi:hypothetical protein
MWAWALMPKTGWRTAELAHLPPAEWVGGWGAILGPGLPGADHMGVDVSVPYLRASNRAPRTLALRAAN